MNRNFSLGKWVAESVDLGAIKKENDLHARYRAVFFSSEKDRDCFYDLSVESYPGRKFIRDSIDYEFIIQTPV